MKEKMLVRLEKERLQARTEALEAQVNNLLHALCCCTPSASPTCMLVRLTRLAKYV